MPFDFEAYDRKCATLDGDALQLEWEHYTRMISGAAASTTVSGAAVPLTFGVSLIGVGLAAPAIHNARKKREIIGKHMQRVGRTHNTRKRDVVAAATISSTIGILTLGLAPVGADAICNSAATHGIAYVAENELGVKVATHFALDAAMGVAEQTHMKSKKEQEAWKACSPNFEASKILSLPNTSLTAPTTMDGYAAGFSGTCQNNSARTNLAIRTLPPPPEQQNSVKASTLYFPPPPGSSDSDTKSLSHGRHSVSTLSLDSHNLYSGLSQLQSDDRQVMGITTAISAPMIANQSYSVQLGGQLNNTSIRPASEVDTNPPFAVPTKVPVIASDLLLQGQSAPPAHRLVQPYGIESQQYQTPEYIPEAYQPASFDRLPDCANDQQYQYLYSTSQLSPPLHSTTMSSVPPPYTPTAPADLGHSPSHFPCYAPDYYTEAQQPRPDMSATVYSDYSPSHLINNQEKPVGLPYRVQSPFITTSELKQPALTVFNVTERHRAPSPWQGHSPPAGKSAIQSVLYFPPPPTAY